MPKKNPFTTFKDNYSGNPWGAERKIDEDATADIMAHYESLYNAISVTMASGKKDVAYGTYAKQAEILKQIGKRLSEFKGDAGASLIDAMKKSAAYQTRLAIDDMKLLGLDIVKPEEWHQDYNDDYVSKNFADTFSHIAGQSDKMLLTTKLELRADSAAIFRRASVEGWSRKRAHKELRSQVLDRDPAFKFTDRAGRQWDTRNYFDMLTKTVMKTTQNEVYTNTLINEGHDLVKINHNGAKDACRKWEGKVVSLTGATPGYLTLEYAKSTGEVFHPRCKHRLLAYNPEIDNVFQLLDAGVTDSDVMGGTKKEILDNITLDADEADLVATRFHDPKHQAFYLTALKVARLRMQEIEGNLKNETGLEFKDMFGIYGEGQGGSQDQKALYRNHFRNPLQGLTDQYCSRTFGMVNRWQGSTHSREPMALKVLYAALEGNPHDVLWRKKNITDDELEDKKQYADQMVSDPKMVLEYIRLRALNQAYMERIKLTEIELMRGTEGNAGRTYASALSKNPNSEYLKVRDANLTGYTTSKKTAANFGVNQGGITVTRSFGAGDIIVHRDLMTGVIGSYSHEEEFIVTGGQQIIPVVKIKYVRGESGPDSKPDYSKYSPYAQEVILKGKPVPTKEEAKALESEGKITKHDKQSFWHYNNQLAKGKVPKASMFSSLTPYVQSLMDEHAPMPTKDEATDLYEMGQITLKDLECIIDQVHVNPAAEKAKINKVQVEGQWFEAILKQNKPMPKIEAAEELYDSGQINKAEYNAYLKANGYKYDADSKLFKL